MPDALTGTVESNLDTAAYQLSMYYALRNRLVFDACATVQATRQSHVGASVTFTKGTDMAIDATPLNEYADVTAVALADTPLTVTMAEYGAATVTTARLRGTSFIEFSPTVSNRVNYNAGATIDLLARTALDAGTNTHTPLDGTGQIIKSADVRAIGAKLADANVDPFSDGFYRAFVTAKIAADLRGESGTAAWRPPHEYSSFVQIMRGEIGVYEGFRFVEVASSQLAVAASAYNCLFLGNEALAKAYSATDGNGAMPSIRAGAVTDKLQRFRPLGWYWLGGYKIFRPEAVIEAGFKTAIV